MKDQWLEGKYAVIMEIAKTLGMDELQVLEKMIQDLWKEKANVQSDIQK